MTGMELKRLRLEHGLTLAVLGAHFGERGVTVARIRQIELQRAPSQHAVEKFKAAVETCLERRAAAFNHAVEGSDFNNRKLGGGRG